MLAAENFNKRHILYSFIFLEKILHALS